MGLFKPPLLVSSLTRNPQLNSDVVIKIHNANKCLFSSSVVFSAVWEAGPANASFMVTVALTMLKCPRNQLLMIS